MAGRIVLATFGDHCFPRAPLTGDDPALRYRRSSRRPVGHSCFERYSLSLAPPGLVGAAVRGLAYNVEGGKFAFVPTIAATGGPVLYAIVFSLDPAPGLPVDLIMRVGSAYPCDGGEIATFGPAGERFAHLMTIRLKGKRPPRDTSDRRKRPRLRSPP